MDAALPLASNQYWNELTSPAITPLTVASAIAGTPRARSTIVPARAAVPRPTAERSRRNGWSWGRRHVRGYNHYRSMRAYADTLAAQIFFVAECQVNDAPLAAGHGVEVEGHTRALYLVRGGKSAHTQFFNAQ